MAFKARLNFSGKEYNVLHCSSALNRDVDAKGSLLCHRNNGKFQISARQFKLGDTEHINGWPKA